MGNEYEVKITRHALEQMRVIAHYISYDLMAPEVAEKLLNDLKSEIMKPWKSEGVRKIAVKNFLVYYWVDDEHNRVQVIAVIYSRRDQIKQLQKMDMQ